MGKIKKDSGVIISADKSSVMPAEAAALYIELGWGTKKEYSTPRMRRSLAKCDIVVSARNDAGELIGISRALSGFRDHDEDTRRCYRSRNIKDRVSACASWRKSRRLQKERTSTGKRNARTSTFFSGCGYRKAERTYGLREKIRRNCNRT